MRRLALTTMGFVCFAGIPAGAEEGGTSAPSDPLRRAEAVVVSATKTEAPIGDAPATLSVVDREELATTAATEVSEVMRTVPGTNVVQTSARDFGVTNRQATSTLANSQLVLLDGRSIYLDFFGIVMWDLLPVDLSEVQQIEVVRGPASAVWGANALTGVVHVITRPARETTGGSLILRGGGFGRSGGSREESGAGFAGGAHLSWSGALSDRLAYRVTGGYSASEPYSRPVGFVPKSTHPLDPGVAIGGGAYPADEAGRLGAFENQGTAQPKLDVRVDHEVSSSTHLTYAAGYAGTEGIVHTGIGPFRLELGSRMAYGRAALTRGGLRLQAFTNQLDAEAPNLLLVDPGTNAPVQLSFRTGTFDLEAGYTRAFARRHVLSVGGNARHNDFEISLAPGAAPRNEAGLYAQDEIIWSRVRVALGGRLDKLANLARPVFSPRVAVTLKPAGGHALRLSLNQAFRSPSVIANFLEQPIYAPTPVDLTPLAPFLPPPLQSAARVYPLVVWNVGNVALTEEKLTAYEVAYSASLGARTTLALAAYQNDSDNAINFASLLPSAENPAGLPGYTVYTPADPPPGIPAPLVRILGALPPALGGPVILPKTVSSYLNLGPVRNRGLELSLDVRPARGVTMSAGYSWQDQPAVLDPEPGQIRFPTLELSLPATHRAHLRVGVDRAHWFGSLSLTGTTRTFWNDVLGLEYAGYTGAHVALNATIGHRFAGGRVTTLLKGTNLTNSGVQQHIYGDIIGPSVGFEVRLATNAGDAQAR